MYTIYDSVLSKILFDYQKNISKTHGVLLWLINKGIKSYGVKPDQFN